MRRWSFSKGHGTENDFVLITDREQTLRFGADEVRRICDRHAGVGADGVLRAVAGRHADDWDGAEDVWFMDYRNADGSVAETCGNGIRVFARYLLDHGLATGPMLRIGTRAGLREVTALPDGRFRTTMGPVRLPGMAVKVTAGDWVFDATAVDVGNPHAVSFVADADLALSDLDLHAPPTWAPASAFPDGVNLEFVDVRAPGHLALRVFERGVGETRSCGTGTVAAATAARARATSGAPNPDSAGGRYRVDVPGGTVEVDIDSEEATLTGPAVLVASGELTLP